MTVTLIDDLELAGRWTPALRKREALLFQEMTAVATTAPPERIDAWLRALGMWFSDEATFLTSTILDVDDTRRAGAMLRSLRAHASRAGGLRILVALTLLGERETEHAAAILTRPDVPAGIAFQIAEALDVKLSDAGAALMATRVVEALRAVPPARRAELAEALKLPISARRLRQSAAPLLRVLVEDESLRPHFADRAASLWIELDLHDGLPAALGAVDEVNGLTLLALAAHVDREEAIEFLAARFDRDPFFAELLSRAGAPFLHDDDRWVPRALSQLDREPRVAARLLRLIGTQRAIEELGGLIDRATAVDDVACVEAVVALGTIKHASLDSVAQWFERFDTSVISRDFDEPFRQRQARQLQRQAIAEALYFRREELNRLLAQHPAALARVEGFLGRASPDSSDGEYEHE